jgi:hypothetical protein
MNKPIIPFGWLPGHWGLSGKTRDRAQAEYELVGLDLDLRLAEIDHDDLKSRQLAQLDVKFKHGVISQYDHEVEHARLRLQDDPLLAEVLLDVELKHHRISKQEHDRKLADLREEPWVNMPDMKWDPADPTKSYFQLDYNDHFVAFLRSHNYTGASDEQIVERWLNDVCRSVAAEITVEDPTFVSTATPVTRKTRKGRKGKAEYS